MIFAILSLVAGLLILACSINEHRNERTANGRAAFCIVLLLFAAFGIALTALAHEWYPTQCCSGTDCWPADDGSKEPAPVATPKGWKLSDGTVVPYNRTRPSPDGQFHICRRGGNVSGALITPTDEPPCLWAPQGGV